MLVLTAKLLRASADEHTLNISPREERHQCGKGQNKHKYHDRCHLPAHVCQVQQGNWDQQDRHSHTDSHELGDKCNFGARKVVDFLVLSAMNQLLFLQELL